MSTWDVYNYLTRQPGQHLIVDWGDPSSQQAAHDASLSATGVVADLSGLMTLRERGLLRLPRELFDEVVVAQATLDSIEHVLRLRLDMQRRGGGKWVGKSEAGFTYTEASPEDLQPEIDALEELAEFIKAECSVAPRPIESLAADGERLTEMLGEAAIDAMNLAASGRVLFADDRGLISLAKGEAGVAGFSSYWLFRRAVDEGFLAKEDFAKVVSDLIGANHSFVPVNGDLILAALQQDRYELSPRVLKVLDRLGPEYSNSESAAGVAVGALRTLALSDVGGASLEPIAGAIFERLTRDEMAETAAPLLRALIRRAFQFLPIQRDRLLGQLATIVSVRHS